MSDIPQKAPSIINKHDTDIEFPEDLDVIKQFKDEYYILKLAKYFFKRREAWDRKDGSSDDNYFKAKYAIELLEFLVEKNPKKYVMFVKKTLDKDEEERLWNYLINLVFGIFDTAYYLHIQYPHNSSFNNFVTAERICCKEKEINYIAENIFLKRRETGESGTKESDWFKAEKIYRENKIRDLAQSNYQKRQKRNTPGTPEDDWLSAEEEYNNNEIISWLAEECWGMSKIKHMTEDVYWNYGRNVHMDLRNNEVIISNPQDLTNGIVYNTIISILRKYDNLATKFEVVGTMSPASN
jgi:hypothetical protein